MMSVGDTGAGMMPRCRRDLRAVLFDQGAVERDRPRPGDGLRHRAAERRIGVVQSAPGAGTTFTIYLHGRGGAAEARAVETAASLHGSETVLIVEDDRDVRSVISVFLRQHGYSVLERRAGSRL